MDFSEAKRLAVLLGALSTTTVGLTMTSQPLPCASPPFTPRFRGGQDYERAKNEALMEEAKKQYEMRNTLVSFLGNPIKFEGDIPALLRVRHRDWILLWEAQVILWLHGSRTLTNVTIFIFVSQEAEKLHVDYAFLAQVQSLHTSIFSRLQVKTKIRRAIETVSTVVASAVDLPAICPSHLPAICLQQMDVPLMRWAVQEIEAIAPPEEELCKVGTDISAQDE